MEGSPTVSLEARVAKLEGQLSQLVSTVTDFISASETWRKDISGAIGRVSEHVAERTRPNLSIMAAWAGIVLMIVAAIATPMQINGRRESDRHEKAIESLDTKLQREYQLMNDKTAQSVENLNGLSKERHETASKYTANVQTNVDKLWEWVNAQAQADMNELRQRRMRDGAAVK